MRLTLLLLLSLTTLANAQLRRAENKWIKVSEESFSLSPGVTKNMDISGEGRFRVEISADSPVAFGIASKSQLDSATDNRVAFEETPCGAVDVLKTSKECEPPTGTKWFTVYDQRNPNDKVLAALIRSGAMMDRSTAPNKITVTVYRLSCIANCPSLPKEQEPNSDREHAQAK